LEGLYKGRPEDTARNAGIVGRLKAGQSWSAIQAATGCSRATIAKLAKPVEVALSSELAVNLSVRYMAILIPSLGFARFDSRGELRLAERLKDFLEENAVVWHNLPVGPHSRHPDFIIVHPANGLLVLEVKDWRLESIVLADKAKVVAASP
jgi:Nuclease-related domain